MLVKTKEGKWLNPARVAWIEQWHNTGVQERSRVYFSGRVDDEGDCFHFDCIEFMETPDELAALLNGAETAPRLVELLTTGCKGVACIAPGEVAYINPYMRRFEQGGPEVECTWLCLKVGGDGDGERGTEFVVALPYEECKRRLGLAGESEVPA